MQGAPRGRSSSVERKLPKLQRRVRLPSPAQKDNPGACLGVVLLCCDYVATCGSRTREGWPGRAGAPASARASREAAALRAGRRRSRRAAPSPAPLRGMTTLHNCHHTHATMHTTALRQRCHRRTSPTTRQPCTTAITRTPPCTQQHSGKDVVAQPARASATQARADSRRNRTEPCGPRPHSHHTAHARSSGESAAARRMLIPRRPERCR